MVRFTGFAASFGGFGAPVFENQRIREILRPVDIGNSATNKKARQLPGFLFGGADGDRTHDLRIANATLSQLSYRPLEPCARV